MVGLSARFFTSFSSFSILLSTERIREGGVREGGSNDCIFFALRLVFSKGSRTAGLVKGHGTWSFYRIAREFCSGKKCIGSQRRG